MAGLCETHKRTVYVWRLKLLIVLERFRTLKKAKTAGRFISHLSSAVMLRAAAWSPATVHTVPGAFTLMYELFLY